MSNVLEQLQEALRQRDEARDAWQKSKARCCPHVADEAADSACEAAFKAFERASRDYYGLVLENAAALIECVSAASESRRLMTEVERVMIDLNQSVIASAKARWGPSATENYRNASLKATEATKLYTESEKRLKEAFGALGVTHE